MMPDMIEIEYDNGTRLSPQHKLLTLIGQWHNKSLWENFLKISSLMHVLVLSPLCGVAS